MDMVEWPGRVLLPKGVEKKKHMSEPECRLHILVIPIQVRRLHCSNLSHHEGAKN